MNVETQGLLRMAEESVHAARLLANEGLNRFAVSRAYYAMFYCAQALLLSKELSFSRHSGVIAAFGKEFAKTNLLPQELHRFLIEASELREVGDYDFAAVIENHECVEQLVRAEQFLRASHEYLQSL